MKTIFLSLLALLCLFGPAVKAQTITNGTFENWQSFGLYSDPQGWSTNNGIGMLTGMFPVTKTNSAHSGSFAMRLETKQMIMGTDTMKMAGMALLGNGGGIAFSARPAALEGFMKYLPQGVDSCIIMVTLTRFDQQSQTSEYVGFGMLVAGGTGNGFQSFRIPLDYKDQTMPDSAQVMILSSYADGVEGSALTIDDLQFTNVSGIAEKAAPAMLKVYPNPCRDFAHVELRNGLQPGTKLFLTDLLGRRMPLPTGQTAQTGSYTIRLELPDLPEGLYVVTAEHEGAVVEQARLQVQR